MSGCYLFDNVWVYAREDRGPFRLAALEQGSRVAAGLWEENQPRQPEDRAWFLTSRIREVRKEGEV